MRKSFANGKAYHYFIFIFILLLAILAFYLSCESKSPTEPGSRLNTQVAAQSTNNTTTSSSTTTSVKPGQSPTNTTTLITSRTLTSTSTRTTTTSSSTTSTTTTSRKPATSTTSTTSSTSSTSSTTTSMPAAILEWCSFDVARMSGGSPDVVSQQNQVVSIAVSDQGIVICIFEMKNIGTAATTNLTISIDQVVGNANHLDIQVNSADFSSQNQIPNTGICTLATAFPCITILLSGATSGEEFTITLIENVTQKTFSFKLQIT